jgi:hypothetical protein
MQSPRPQSPNGPPDLPTQATLPALSAPVAIPPVEYPSTEYPESHPESHPQPRRRRKSSRRRISAVHKISGCSALLLVCALFSSLGLALGGSGGLDQFLGNGVARNTATATTDTATADTSEASATVDTQPTTTSHPQPTGTPRPRPTNTATRPANTPCPDPACNPWGYNFSCCNYITSPQSAFCSYFACIGTPPNYTNFWSGTGYVVQCNDGLYTRTGGTKGGSCSGDNGYMRTLYKP